jgi:hypothetical protein
MDSTQQFNVSRRHLLGLGAAGAATVAALTAHTPFAAAQEGDVEASGRQLPNYTAVTQLAGLQAATLGYADFQALSTGANKVWPMPIRPRSTTRTPPAVSPPPFGCRSGRSSARSTSSASVAARPWAT